MEIQEEKEKENEVEVVDFDILPEGCISSILSLTSPRDACRSSLVSTLFKFAAESDALWEKFLPSDYLEIIARSSSPSSNTSSSSTSSVVNFSSKKELYFSLCDNPILIDGGLKSFALEKWSGKKCFMLGARELSIVWACTPKYWRWRAFPGSRFAEVAELLEVCWFEIHGKLGTRLLSPNTFYTIYLVFKFVDSAYGFNHPPAEAVIKLVGGGGNSACSGERAVYLDPDGSHRRQLQFAPRRTGLLLRRFSHILRPPPSMSRLEGQFPQERGDGWLEAEMGHFFNDGGEDGGGELHMTLTEIKGGHWKAGLIIEGIELRPITKEIK